MNLDNDDILENEQRDLQESDSLEEDLQESDPLEEDLQESDPLEEDLQESDPLEEDLQESDPLEEDLQESITIDYSQDFIILENIGYFQLSLLGTLVLFFVMSLVIKFIKSFF